MTGCCSAQEGKLWGPLRPAARSAVFFVIFMLAETKLFRIIFASSRSETSAFSVPGIYLDGDAPGLPTVMEYRFFLSKYRVPSTKSAVWWEARRSHLGVIYEAEEIATGRKVDLQLIPAFLLGEGEREDS